MKTLRRFLFLAILLAALPASYALAALPKVAVLYAETDAAAADVQTKLQATGQFTSVGMINMMSTAPTLATLQAYDAVICFTDYPAATGTGDVLAQYIDGGGGVVNCMFSDFSASYTINGNFNTSTYQVISPSGSYTTASASLGSVAQPSHPIMKNVSSFSATTAYRGLNSTLVGSAYVIAYWSDGYPLISARENVGTKKARRVDLNFFPISSSYSGSWWNASTDGGKIMANALTWTVNTAIPAQMTVQPKTLNFGNVVGGTPTTLTFRVTSLGPGTLKFTSQCGLSGNPDFSITGIAPVTNDSLQVGQFRDVSVTFNPVTGGTRTAQLTVYTNGADSGTQVVNLVGVGIAPAINMSTTSLFRKDRVKLGDSLSRTFPVTSSGTGPLTFNSFVWSGLNPTEYKVTKTPANPLAINQTDSIKVTYYPTFEGRPDATLTVNSNALNAPSLQVQMFGSGILPRLVITPSPLAFGNVGTGSTDTMQLMLSNPGTDTLQIKADYFSSADADYKLIPLLASDMAIAPNVTKTLGVIFKPVKQGIRRATLRVTTNIPLTFETTRRDTSGFSVEITGIGVPYGKLSVSGQFVDSAIVGQQQCYNDTIWNTGQADLMVSSLTLAGTDAADFSVNGVTFPFTLPAGGSQIVSICFKPSGRGLRNASGTITGTTNGLAQVITVPVVGFGMQVCAQADNSTMFATDKPIVNSTKTGSATNTVTITNCGDVPTVYVAKLTAGSSPAYTLTGSGTSATIAAGGTATFTVTFTPTVRGLATGMLDVTGGAGVTPITISLSGVGYNADITGTGTAATTTIGQCSNFDVNVMNNGNIDWTSGTNATFTPAGEYTLVTGGTIAANASGTLTFKFCPSASGPRSSTVTFPGQTPDMNMASVMLSGNGTTSGVAMITAKDGFSLDQNYPNPSKGTSQIHFVTPQPAMVTLVVTDMTGAVVSTVANGRYDMGDHTVPFDASSLASGTYFYTLISGDVRLTRQMVIAK